MHLRGLPTVRKVLPLRSLFWLQSGWRLFTGHPVEWLLTALLAFSLLALSTLLVPIPLLGPVFPPLLLALLLGGMLHAAMRQQAGEAPRVEDMFAGIRRHPGKLALAGLFYAVPLVLIHLLTYLAISGSLLVSLFGMAVGGGLQQLLERMLTHLADFGILLLALLFLWGLMMQALLLAPALIMRHDLSTFDAMRLALTAGLRNLPAIVILGLLLYVLLILALAPLGLGFLVYIPLVAGTVHAATEDLFVVPALPALENP
ncbi:MAG: hypothetical protein CGU28_00440 [Candidatus Dactylopiibacterium carminicum]|uniref:DUF2189 domain-containing protein n=1 Tax=Candidatus Dactylopiibacterium carminicum TaxID=857335 RepID=A0A272EZ20_9RHOO|nr:BPSS1780 family membrane protein [Candidatus Dactylopiibacterium carminicum]KAF7600836.1 hypothetical protein BGI27_00335 [Candidatus Dactylopiibacterium carminicum]PAS95335.1 MAG: hypothetical protein CGU29_00370 [Candidatus Dactylopiibacterium carminicum]PAS98653.1 MAG: hypothetical protein CGU28_00440 [Candidatus Dactylopiibacterium carminicum]PAT00840.1 MAG: hypothetical protein BSR46_00335 [Candidatus Dactylopiibacterium carminicum]